MVPIPVRPPLVPPALDLALFQRAPLEVARELGEARRARAVARGEREQGLAVREDRLEEVAARRRVRARADLRADRLQVRAAAVVCGGRGTWLCGGRWAAAARDTCQRRKSTRREGRGRGGEGARART